MSGRDEQFDVDSAAAELSMLLPDDAFDRRVYEGELKAPGEQQKPPVNEQDVDQEEEIDEQAPESEEAEETASEDEEGDVADEEDGDEDAEDAEDEAPQTFKVKVDGQESDVTLEELVNGYQRQADYTRKTMKLSSEKKAFEEEAATVRAARDEYGLRLKELGTLLDRAKGAEPDWDALKREDPAKYAVKWAEWNQQREIQNAIKAEQDRIADEQKAEQMEQFKAKMTEEQEKLLVAIPEWKDAEVRKKESREIVEFAEKKFGLTKQDVAQFSDHRALVMLRMAMQYDRLKAKGKQVVKEKGAKAPVLRPGQPKPKQQSSKTVARARKRLSTTGRVADAQALFEQILPDDF